jgi:zinc-binding in reverse transcriptase
MSKVKQLFDLVWKTKAPLTIRIFYFLVLHDKLLTQQIMRRRNILHGDGSYIMYQNDPLKLMPHLFFFCPIAVKIWNLL